MNSGNGAWQVGIADDHDPGAEAEEVGLRPITYPRRHGGPAGRMTPVRSVRGADTTDLTGPPPHETPEPETTVALAAP